MLDSPEMVDDRDERGRGLDQAKLQQERTVELERVRRPEAPDVKRPQDRKAERVPGVWEERSLSASARSHQWKMDHATLEKPEVERIGKEVETLRKHCNIDSPTWGHGLNEMKTKAYQSVEKELAALQGRVECRASVFDPQRGEFAHATEAMLDAIGQKMHLKGWYTPGDSKQGPTITINGSTNSQPASGAHPDKWKALDVVLHESRHAFQEAMIAEYRAAMAEQRKPNLHGVSANKVVEWLYAGPPPQPPSSKLEKDYDAKMAAYKSHPWEVDARAYAREVIKQLRGY